MKIGGKIRLFIVNEWKDFTCTAEKESDGADEKEFVFVCDDDPSIVRQLPEWLADCC